MICNVLSENAHVGCVAFFSEAECIRFSYAASEEELREAEKN
jgi:aspartate aminotransferase